MVAMRLLRLRLRFTWLPLLTRLPTLYTHTLLSPLPHTCHTCRCLLPFRFCLLYLCLPAVLVGATHARTRRTAHIAVGYAHYLPRVTVHTHGCPRSALHTTCRFVVTTPRTACHLPPHYRFTAHGLTHSTGYHLQFCTFSYACLHTIHTCHLHYYRGSCGYVTHYTGLVCLPTHATPLPFCHPYHPGSWFWFLPLFWFWFSHCLTHHHAVPHCPRSPGRLPSGSTGLVTLYVILLPAGCYTCSHFTRHVACSCWLAVTRLPTGSMLDGYLDWLFYRSGPHVPHTRYRYRRTLLRYAALPAPLGFCHHTPHAYTPRTSRLPFPTLHWTVTPRLHNGLPVV